MLQGVILAGGRGERFWPLSRRDRPKQLLRLFGDRSMLRLTWDRLRWRLPPERLWVITGSDLEAAIRQDLPELGGDGLIAEVAGRNTAPALAVAAALGVRGGADPVQLIAPSDHLVPDPGAFWDTVEEGLRAIEQQPGGLVTFGIRIDRPDTGYGYIECGERVGGPRSAYAVARFHEKPNEETARAYQAAGSFYWNSGIFLWRARAFLDEVARHLPRLHALVTPLMDAADPHALLDEIFQRADPESVDVAVLEKSAQVRVLPAGFAWSDVGTWERWGDLVAAHAAEETHTGSAARAVGTGSAGAAAGTGEAASRAGTGSAGAAAPRPNATAGDVLCLDSRGCALYAENGLVVTLGLEDMIVVRAGDVTMVLPKSRSAEVRSIIEALREIHPEQGDRL